MTVPDPGPARHFIAGQFTDSVSGEWFDHINPATEAADGEGRQGRQR